MHYNADGTYATKSQLLVVLKDVEDRLAEAERRLEAHRLALWALSVALKERQAKDGPNRPQH
jgi:hypothetical protein